MGPPLSPTASLPSSRGECICSASSVACFTDAPRHGSYVKHVSTTRPRGIRMPRMHDSYLLAGLTLACGGIAMQAIQLR